MTVKILLKEETVVNKKSPKLGDIKLYISFFCNLYIHKLNLYNSYQELYINTLMYML